MPGSAPAQPVSRFRSADRLLLTALRRSAPWLAVLVVAELGGAAAALWVPTVLAAAIDDTLAGREPLAAVARVAATLALEATALLLGVIAVTRIGAGSTAWLRRRLLGHVLTLGTAGPRRFAAADLTTRLISDASPVGVTGPMAVSMLGAVVTAVGGMVALWLIDWRIVVALAVVLLPAWWVVRALVKDFSDLFVRYSVVLAQIAGRLTAALRGVRTVAASGTIHREEERVLGPVPELSKAGNAMWSAQRRAVVQLGTVTPLIWVGILSLVGFGVAEGRISPGEFVAAGSYTALVMGVLGQLEGLIAVAHARAAAARVSEVLDLDPPARGRAVPPPGPGELVLRGVTVRDGDEVVLDRLHLRVPPGATMALVGEGTSTLATVAAGLTVPDAGEVLLDGIDLRAVAAAELPRAIACAFARPALLGSTVADAIGYGRPGAARRELEQAAHIAHADGFVRRLPLGFDTPLADAPLSGGEAQRLGLARAVAAAARLTVFDDATSSLDVVTEMLVCSAITTRLPGRTRIVVTHRAATAARTDLVAWIDSGRVRAVAPHGRLWADPAYRAVFGDAR